MAWLAATLTHGISETHVAHHVNSKIPHYHAWEATDALRARLANAGIKLQGRNSGWGEMYRVYKQCKVCPSFPSLRKYLPSFSSSRPREILCSTRTPKDWQLPDPKLLVPTPMMDTILEWKFPKSSNETLRTHLTNVGIILHLHSAN